MYFLEMIHAKIVSDINYLDVQILQLEIFGELRHMIKLGMMEKEQVRFW